MVKRKIYEVIEEDVSDSLRHKIFEVFIVTLIILNVIAIIVESSLKKSVILDGFEKFSVAVFTLEYLLRLWTADLKYSENNGGNKSKANSSFKLNSRFRSNSRLKFIFSTFGMIDLLAIVPFYISLFLPVIIDGRILRVLRLLRLLRLLKLYRFLSSFALIKKVIVSRRYELLTTGFIAFITLVVASTLMYELEHDAQPDKFPDVLSAFWWAVATLTTIGYGDIYPITGLGRFVSAVISLVGIGLIALPTGILGTSFIEEFRNRNADEKEPGDRDERKATVAFDKIAMADGYEPGDEKVDVAGNVGGEIMDICPHCGRRLKE